MTLLPLLEHLHWRISFSGIVNIKFMLKKSPKYSKNADFVPKGNMNLGSFLSLELLKVAQVFVISPDTISQKINISEVLLLNN